MIRDASENRRNGWWRDQTFLDDLRRNAKERPDESVFIAYRPEDGDQPRIIDYAELARVTDSFAAALTGLGIRNGDVDAPPRTAKRKVRKAELRERFIGT